MAIDLEKYRKATTTGSVAPNAPARPVNLEKYKKKPGVIPQPTPQQEQPGFLKSLVMSTGIPRFAANVVRIGQILTPGGVTAADIAKDPAKPVNMPWLGPVKPVGQEGTFGERLRDTFGESAKLAATVVPVGGGAVQVGKAALGGRILRGAGQGVKAGAIGGGLYGFGEGIQQKDATVGSVLGSTAIGAGLGAAGGGVLGTAFPLVGAGARNIYSRVTTPAITRAKQEVQVQFEKGVKPNLPGKTTPTTRTKFNNQIAEGVSVINNNKAGLQFVDDLGDTVTGRAPRTLKEFADSIEQTKDRIFTQYDNLATRAGDAGVQVDVLPIANELDQVINNKALQLSHPDAVAYAQSVQRRFQTAGPIDTKTAQEVIKNYNNSLQAFYRNPTPEGLTRNAVDAMMVNRIRKALDDGIEGLTGASYQALKNQYAALKAIERDVMRATLRDARRNVKGLIDYTDIFSGGQVVQGILSMNPATVASGVTQKAISSYFKYLNNPNRAIQKMFEAADRLPVQQSTIPLSTRKQLPAPRPGTPNVQVETPINLGARSQSTIDAQEMARLQSNQLPANSRRATMPAATMNTNVSRNVMPTVKQGTQPLSTPLSTGARQDVSSSKSITQKVKDWYKASGLDDERGFIKVPYIRDDIGSYVQSNPRGRNLDVEARKLFNIFKDEPTADESAMYVVRQFLSGKSGGGINRTELATALDILRNNAKKIYVAQRPAQRAPSNKSVMPKPKQKAEPKSKEKSLYSKIKDFLFPPGIPRDRGMVNLKAIADDLTGKTSKADDLLTEAKKYETVEEFANKQYHLVKNQSIDPRKIKLSGDASEKTALDRSKGMVPIESVDKPITLKINKDGGFQVVDGNARVIAHINQNRPVTKYVLDTKYSDKSQLTDIWNQANKSTQKAVSTTDNLITEARKYKTADEFVRAQKVQFDGITNGMEHRPTKTGATADNVSQDISEMGMPDFYEHPEYYNYGGKEYAESISALMRIKGKPNADITIYRASPKNELRTGDWVTLSKEKAKLESLNEGTQVHSFKVKANEIEFAGDDVTEFGYWGHSSEVKSQLTDIWNQANKSTQKAVSTTDNLITEARKYKTAEEFVKAQGTPVYHGTKKKFDTFRDPQGGYLSDAIFFAPSEYKATYYSEGITDDPGYMHEAYISPKAKLWDYRNADDVRKLKTFVENDTAFGKYLNENWNYKKADVVKKIKQGDYTWVQRPEIIKELKRLRYDGFVNVDHYPTGADISYGVFSSSNIKTRSQLTDIWNKANRK